MSKLLPITLTAAALIGFGCAATAQDNRGPKTLAQEPSRAGEYLTQPADPSSPRVKFLTPELPTYAWEEVPPYTWEESRAFERATGEDFH